MQTALYSTNFKKGEDVLIGTFLVQNGGVVFIPAGLTEPISEDEFSARFGFEYPARVTRNMISAKFDPEAYVRNLPGRWSNGYIYAVLEN